MAFPAPEPGLRDILLIAGTGAAKGKAAPARNETLPKQNYGTLNE